MLALLLSPCATLAHPLAPALLELHELSPNHFAVHWKQPLVQPAGSALAPLLPESCTVASVAQTSSDAVSLSRRWQVVCRDGLINAPVAVSGLADSGAVAVVRVQLADRRVVSAVLGAGDDALVIPPRSSPWQVARSYFGLGLAHLFGGWDHLLFVFGLTLIAPTRRRLLANITAFTAGHSVTLALAVLGYVRLPVAWVELCIALSLLALAHEVGRGREAVPGRGTLMALGFGWLHGLGFAAALSEAGLPPGEIPLALAAFNVGIE
ncbi:MAG TPA: HupE/UreJ family protein, partial [Terriglobales bacterium]|nr:HupE/UreJ family protein [Terriglobales bacterium]